MHPEMGPNYSKQRLIFRPKSLLLGWWGGMHPPPKSATATTDISIIPPKNLYKLIPRDSVICFQDRKRNAISLPNSLDDQTFVL